MSFLDKKVYVYGPKVVSVGDLDLSVDGCYRNVVTIPLDVKPNRFLHVHMTSDNPVDIVVANDDNSAAGHKEGQTDVELGPYSTGKSNSMGIILGVFRGDKAKVNLEAWMAKE